MASVCSVAATPRPRSESDLGASRRRASSWVGTRRSRCRGDLQGCDDGVGREMVGACTCGTRRGRRTARRACTSNGRARCVAVARWCGRAWRNRASSMPRVAGEPRVLRGASPAVPPRLRSGRCSRARFGHPFGHPRDARCRTPSRDVAPSDFGELRTLGSAGSSPTRIAMGSTASRKDVGMSST